MSYMIYRDSLSRMYGAPGSGKSFVALDLALSLAAGRFWAGRRLKAQRVIYVMAEGQAVNGDRMEAWMSKNNVTLEMLDGQFFAVPDAVMLTEIGVKQLVDWVAENQPTLVVLDTKNAMMVGEENSASDFAVMRRALDMIRKAAACCVLLVDHTGYEGTRARGSSAGTAAMDTEIRVTMDDEQRPALITAEVTRDKAAEAGLSHAWHLVPEHPAAVLVPTDVPEQKLKRELPEWERAADVRVPDSLRDYKGPGEKVIHALAQMMMFETSLRNDPEQLGMNLSKAQQVLKDHERTGVRRAWSKLKSKGYLASSLDSPTELQDATGPHIWSGPSGSSGDQSGDQLK
jgi:AAA domain